MSNETVNEMDGCLVTHKTFGRGIVKKINIRKSQEGTIVVDFNEKKDCKFVFPVAFLNPNQILHTNEPQIVQFLNEHCRCAGCMELKKSDQGYVQPYLCTDCYGKYKKCDFCGNYKLKESFKKLSSMEYDEPNQICSDCYVEQCFTCEECNKTYLKKFKPVNKYIKDGQQLCQSCLEFYFNECDNCGEYVPDEYTVFTTHAKYCHDCFEKISIKCDRCGERFVPLTSEHYCDNCLREISEKTREELYFKEWKKFDFGSRKIKELGFYQLKKTLLVDFMTKFHPESEGQEESYDILILYAGGSGYILLNNKKTSFKDLWPYACESYTMSEIKKDPWKIYFSFQPDYYPEPIDFGDTLLKLWKKPIRVGAHTRFDEDYRKEYYQGDLVYEGNEYGDTTSFYIIGEFVKKNNNSD